jgi:hypothetical protein
MGKSRKAKIKKSKKARCEVRRVCLLISPSRIHCADSAQAAPPRFLYVNQEILKRKDPVSINVRRFLSFLVYAR